MRPTPYPTMLALALGIAAFSPVAEVRAEAPAPAAPAPAAAPAAAAVVETAPAASTGDASAPAGVLEPSPSGLGTDAALADPSRRMQRELKAAMDLDLAALFAAERAEVADLRRQLSALTDDGAALALLQQIEARKQQAELDCMRIQVRYAREAGLQQQTQELEAELERMLHPERAAQPAAAIPVEATPSTPAAKE